MNGDGVGLISLGFWGGPATDPSWPAVTEFVDLHWDVEERAFVADYLDRGLVARSYMGYSRCRICGRDNGALEFSDGTFVWPEGLAHYVRDHGVRLPEPFVAHARALIEWLEASARDESWWRDQSLAP
jgi:hypothetical protein